MIPVFPPMRTVKRGHEDQELGIDPVNWLSLYQMIEEVRRQVEGREPVSKLFVRSSCRDSMFEGKFWINVSKKTPESWLLAK